MDWLKGIFEKEENDKEAEITAYINENYIEKAVFDEEIEKARKEIEEEKRERAIEYEIDKNGGKNVKAIKALIEDDDISVDENGSIIIDLKRIIEEAPYLFTDKKEELEGTGVYKKGEKKRKDTILDYARKGAGLE